MKKMLFRMAKMERFIWKLSKHAKEMMVERGITKELK